MSIKKWAISALAALVCAGIAFGWYEYHRKPADVSELSALQVTAPGLLHAYTTNEQKANALYLNKAVEVSGKVIDVKQTPGAATQVILDAGDAISGIACTIDKPQRAISTGDQITVKGICTGFLNDVVLTRSILVK